MTSMSRTSDSTRGPASRFDRYYFLRPGFVNGTVEFHQMISERIRPGASILEVGSGPLNPTSTFLATIGPTTGIDVDRDIESNSTLVSKRVFDGRNFPFPDAHFDACVSNYVLEHLEDPEQHFREVARVLRPDGAYCFRTPNLCHYVAFASWILPHAFHSSVANRLRGLSADSHDPYKTFYRSNSRAAILRLSRVAGLNPIVLRMVEKEPSYGASSRVLFYPMMAYERLVNRTEVLSGFRANFFGVLQKPW